MAQGAAQDQWEDVTPGAVANAAAAVAPKGGDADWEDVTPKQTLTPGSFQTRRGGPILNANPTKAVTLGQKAANAAKSFGSGVVDIPKSLPQFAEEHNPDSVLGSWPEKQIAEGDQYRARAQDALKSGSLTGFLGQSLNAALAPTMIPQTVEGISSLAETDPARAAGQMTGMALLEKAPEIGAAATEIPEAVRAGNAVQSVKDSIGRATREPGTIEMQPDGSAKIIKPGPLKPGTKLASKVVGAGVGATAGGAGLGPYGAGGGAIAGWTVGPEVAKTILPEHPNPVGNYSRIPNRVAIPETPAEAEFARTKTLTEAQESALSENEKFDRAAQVKESRLQAQVEKSKKARDAAYIERGESIQKQQAYQDKLDAAKVKADNALARSERQAQTQKGAEMAAEIERNKELSRAATDAAEENRARDTKVAQAEDNRVQGLHEKFARSLKELEDHRQKTLADRGKLNEQDAAGRNKRGITEVGPRTSASEPNAPAASQSVTLGKSNQDLVSRARKIFISGEQPTEADLKSAGDMTQSPLQALKDLAKHDDVLAKNELARRLKNGPSTSKRVEISNYPGINPPETPGAPEAVPGTPERRSPANAEQRRRMSEMSPEEMRKELSTSTVTDLPNRRAFDEAGDSPAVGISDVDGLKALNDKFGYDAGDALLKAKADALKEAGVDAYHDKGDEFLYRGDEPQALAAKLEKARELLRNQVIDVTRKDGSVISFRGADFSYGADTEISGAEEKLKSHKAQREARGERSRGELRGITEVGPQNR